MDWFITMPCATTNEQIGEFLLAYDDLLLAVQYLKHSAQLCREYRATVKIEQLMKLYKLHIDVGSGSLRTTQKVQEEGSLKSNDDIELK